LFALLATVGTNIELAAALSVGVICALRVLAIHKDWNLPKVRPQQLHD
jgi:uncharacterized membrane protein YeiH